METEEEIIVRTGRHTARAHGWCFFLLQLEVAEGQAPAMGPDGEVSDYSLLKCQPLPKTMYFLQLSHFLTYTLKNINLNNINTTKNEILVNQMLIIQIITVAVCLNQQQYRTQINKSGFIVLSIFKGFKNIEQL